MPRLCSAGFRRARRASRQRLVAHRRTRHRATGVLPTAMLRLEFASGGYLVDVHIEEAFCVRGVETARSIARAHPFATIVTADLRATHMPCLVDEDAEGLVILGHLACLDPVSEALDRPILLIFHGPHGYVSASWYPRDTIPTWNHVTLHVMGTPDVLDDAMPVLQRTVDRFEAAVEHPWSLQRIGKTAREMADKVVAFRLQAQSWHAEAKLSQDKSEDERARVLAGLEAPGPYRNPPLAAAMRGLDA
jgi:transcriptional regulator